MTIDIDELDRLLKAATPLPWTWYGDELWGPLGPENYDTVDNPRQPIIQTDGGCYGPDDDDKALIAVLNDLPQFIALARRAKELEARLECDHAYRLKDGEMVRVEMQLPEHLDGISCRDETIKELERQLCAALKGSPT